MRAGVARYFRDGLGGGATAAGRFGGSALTAGRLYGVLSGLGGNMPMPREAGLDREVLADRNAQTVLAAVADAVRPVDGTQDAEAARDAVGRALSEVLRQHPDANLLALTEEQRLLAVELYLVEDVFNRVNLDVGGTIRARSPSHTAFVSRLASLKSYITQVILAAFRKLSVQGRQPGRSDVASISRRAVRDAVAVFEEGGE